MELIYLFLFILFTTLLLVFLHDQNKRIVVTHYNLTAEIPTSFRIVHLSDLHSTQFKHLIELVQLQAPDVAMLTGDIINDHGKKQAEMLRYIKQLSALAPVYYIAGNHERRLTNFDEIMTKLAAAGAIVLQNNVATTVINHTPIAVLGLNENQGSFKNYRERRNGKFTYQDNTTLFYSLAKKDGFKIVLSHFPENFACIGDKSYQKYDFDLMLSGHAHGGQFNFPIIGPIYSPGQGLFPRYVKGDFGERPKLIVSRGMGNSEFPFRLFNRPEIVVITVKSK